MLCKSKQTEVGKWHQISGEPVSITIRNPHTFENRLFSVRFSNAFTISKLDNLSSFRTAFENQIFWYSDGYRILEQAKNCFAELLIFQIFLNVLGPFINDVTQIWTFVDPPTLLLVWRHLWMIRYIEMQHKFICILSLKQSPLVFIKLGLTGKGGGGQLGGRSGT